jgi:hypothetical protein
MVKRTAPHAAAYRNENGTARTTVSIPYVRAPSKVKKKTKGARANPAAPPVMPDMTVKATRILNHDAAIP